MIAAIEEFRCPEFLVVEAGDRHVLFLPNDTIGEDIGHAEAVNKVIDKLAASSAHPRLVLAERTAYRRKPEPKPRHIDDKI